MLSTLFRRLWASYLRWLIRCAEDDLRDMRETLHHLPLQIDAHKGYVAELQAELEQMEVGHA